MERGIGRIIKHVLLKFSNYCFVENHKEQFQNSYSEVMARGLCVLEMAQLIIHDQTPPVRIFSIS